MKRIRLYMVAITALGVCTPNVATAAQPPFITAGNRQPRSLVQDVALEPDHKLVIQIVDGQGRPHAGTPINVRKAGSTVHRAVARKDGQVVLPKLTPGVYEVTSGTRGGIYRLWAPQTAPPKVTTGILLIDEGGVVRGSRGGWQKAAIVGGVIITSGVVGGVIGYNLRDAS